MGYFKISYPVVWVEVKQQYHGLVKEFHPDQFKECEREKFETKMQAINKEYATLQLLYDPNSQGSIKDNLRDIETGYAAIKKAQLFAAYYLRMSQPLIEAQGKKAITNKLDDIINNIKPGTVKLLVNLVVNDILKTPQRIQRFDLPTELEKFDLQKIVKAIKKLVA